MAASGRNASKQTYGSEGWGFESLQHADVPLGSSCRRLGRAAGLARRRSWIRRSGARHPTTVWSATQGRHLMAGRKRTRAAKVDKVVPVADYEHTEARRTNNPPAGLAHLDREATPVKTLSYDAHLDPQLTWAGKAERASVDVPAPSVHVHEELSAQQIIGSVRRQRLQGSLFDVDTLDPNKAVEFYQHDLSWSNRMILGDSLTVMASLLERERMAGRSSGLHRPAVRHQLQVELPGTDIGKRTAPTARTRPHPGAGADPGVPGHVGARGSTRT